MTDTEMQALKAFLLDSNCLKKLDKWANDFNIFDILKITNMEIRHSNILAWLLDPNESHFLGSAFIQEFITTIVSKCDHEKYDIFALLLQNFSSYQVYRESNHMDITLVSNEEKAAIIIENKVWSGESSHQLRNYMEKSKTEYPGYTILYVFLTPDGHDSSDPANWIPFSYEELIELLESVSKSSELPQAIDLVIKDYIKTVRKNIMKEKDNELVELCNQIYNKHRTALRLIFENVNIDNSVDSEIICETLRQLSEEECIIYPDNNKWWFFTKQMDSFLPPLSEPNSSWGTDYIYKYWFERYADTLIIHFELIGFELANGDERTEHGNALIKQSKKNGKTVGNFQSRRLYFDKVKLDEDDYENSLREAVRSLVKSALEKENEWLKNIQLELSETDTAHKRLERGKITHE